MVDGHIHFMCFTFNSILVADLIQPQEQNNSQMNSSVIRTVNLRHRFSKHAITLDNINIDVRRGDIYGFLGPNGSGKTTTLSLLLGLLSKQEGRIELFGEDLGSNRVNILKRVGSMIESPSLYGHLTAWENIEVFRRLYDIPRSRAQEVLAITGIADTGSKKVRKFSLGMKQRLGIAIALLPNPELLILDEPTNGLDPAGIIELRGLIKQLNEQHNVTILISSHILAEVEKVVTHVGIIRQGRLVFQGPKQDLFQLCRSRLLLRTSDNIRALELLGGSQSDVANGTIAIPYVDDYHAGYINRMLVENQLDVFQVQPRINDLEQIFLELTSNQS